MTRAHLTLGLSAALVLTAFLAPHLRPLAMAQTGEPEAPVVVDVDPPAAPENFELPQQTEVELPPAPIVRPKVDIVIALDTSDSMEALLDSTRAQIWDIVSRAASAEPTPAIRVGLVTYGTRTGARAEDGWVIQQSDLTSDLDAFYGRLMSVNTRGRDEYVGWAIDEAMTDIEWSGDDNAARMLIVAGNESAFQGPWQHDARGAADRARLNGVRVHTIYVGSHIDGVRNGWDQVARRGGGRFSAIDANLSVHTTATPYDDKLAKLNDALNRTYVPYGVKGASGMANLRAADGATISGGAGVLGARVTTKASAAYRNDDWDLVDAYDAGIDFEAIPEADLPDDIASAPAPERARIVEEKKAERDRVREEIAQVAKDRRRFLSASKPKPRTTATRGDSAPAAVSAAMPSSAPAPAAGLDFAMEAMVTETMEDAGMAFTE